MANPIDATAQAAGDLAAGVKRWTPINWALVSQPWNWAIVLLMVLIGAIAVDLLLQWYNTPDMPEE